MESFWVSKLHKMENNACCCLAKPQLGTTCYIPKNEAGWRGHQSFHPAEIHRANTSGCRCGYIIFRKVTLPAYSATDKQTGSKLWRRKASYLIRSPLPFSITPVES